MWETDDRLADDPVWELFPPRPEECWWGSRPFRVGLGLIGAVLGVIFFRPLAVVSVCAAVAWNDFARARHVRRSIPDPAAGLISSRFAYGWAFWKFGCTAAGLAYMMGLGAFIPGPIVGPAVFSRWIELLVSLAALLVVGFTASSVLTALGLRAALRNGMRVWIGEGVNQARALLLTLLMVGFVAVIFLVCVSLVVFLSSNPTGQSKVSLGLGLVVILVLCAPLPLLWTLDAIARRVLASSPAKFGPKVAAVGKWAKPVATKSPSSRP
jgi:hypothetical protein